MNQSSLGHVAAIGRTMRSDYQSILLAQFSLGKPCALEIFELGDSSSNF